jgi:hypothetical protein
MNILSIKTSLQERRAELVSEYGGLGVEEIQKKILSRADRIATMELSEGSVPFSLGLYVTEDDIDALRKKLDGKCLKISY